MSDEFNTASSESPAVAFMHSWGQGFVKKDVDIIAKHLHHDYRHFIYPKSLGIPEATREEYLQHMRKVISLWSDNEVNRFLSYKLHIWAGFIITLLPQSTVHWITEAQGNLVIAHVRVPNLFSSNVLYTKTLVGYKQDKNCNRRRNRSRIDLYRRNHHRRRQKPQDQTGQGVHRLKSAYRLCSGGHGRKTPVTRAGRESIQNVVARLCIDNAVLWADYFHDYGIDFTI